MTEKQIAALQRILAREVVAYRALACRPAPGQHPSGDKYAISDGNICVLLDAPLPELHMSVRADSLTKFVQNERKNGLHFPVSGGQIDRSFWGKQAHQGGNRPHGVELSAPVLHPEQLTLDDAGTAETPTEVIAEFDPQLLVDAADAVGGSPIFFLGYGPSNEHFPSLLVMPPDYTERNCAEPIALVLPLRW